MVNLLTLIIVTKNQKMKKIICIKILLMTLGAVAQMSSNVIPKNDFFNIQINDVSFRKLVDANGDLNSLNGLLKKQNLKSDVIIDEKYFHYTYDGFNICYSEDEISSFVITNKNWSITVKDKSVKIGSDWSELGNVTLNNRTDGGKSVVFQYCDGCNNYLAFELDGNAKIKKIYYIEMT